MLTRRKARQLLGVLRGSDKRRLLRANQGAHYSPNAVIARCPSLIPACAAASGWASWTLAVVYELVSVILFPHMGWCPRGRLA